MLTAIILTYNEEANLTACLTSLQGLPLTITIVDSGSNDRTLRIAAEHGARVVAHPFESHVSQWRWALQQVDPKSEWVLGLDADQYLSPELSCELAELFRGEDPRLHKFRGFYLNRRQIFRGQWIRHGGYYPKYLLKLFRADSVQLDERDLIDHHFYVSGKTAKLRGDLIEDNRKERDITFWISKHVRYAGLHAQEELWRRTASSPWLIRPAAFGTPDQRVAWLKTLWYHMPLYARPFVYFFYRYFVRAGFLDGKQGFIFHFIQGFWYRLLVDIRIDDLLRQG
jgi:glycosyltransferase involved in cell wall biosynthesis